MKTTWILAADRSGAKLYEHTTPGTLALVRVVEHPDGRLQDREIVSDRSGRTFESNSPHRSTADPQTDPARQEAINFARSLAVMLDSARKAHSYEQLVLVAEPRFLGLLREALDKHTSATVMGSVTHALTNAPEGDLKAHLRDLLNL
jgi:protein required for attachment to host cells